MNLQAGADQKNTPKIAARPSEAFDERLGLLQLNAMMQLFPDEPTGRVASIL